MSPNEVTTPLAFEPIFIERMWGGRRLESEFHKKLPPQKRIGESWEIVDRSETQSVVAGGPLRGKTLHELWTQHREEIFGDVPETPRFPLLIKILDAQQKLSLQVHPPENVASRLGGEPKSEFWYVTVADPDAELFLGFSEPITRERFEERLRDGTLIDHVHRIAVEAGDAVFLPAGRVHAVGAGNLLIEIQQNSDTTYRVFDWNRTDPATGTKRDLHVEQAIQCIDFEDVQPKLIQSEGELADQRPPVRNSKMESRRSPRSSSARTIRNRLLSHRKSQLREGQAVARRIFSCPSPFGGPTTDTTRARHNSVASNDSGTITLDLHPTPLDKLRILDGHQVCFRLRLFFLGCRHDERARST